MNTNLLDFVAKIIPHPRVLNVDYEYFLKSKPRMKYMKEGLIDFQKKYFPGITWDELLLRKLLGYEIKKKHLKEWKNEKLKQEDFGEIVKITWIEYYGDKWDRQLKSAQMPESVREEQRLQLEKAVSRWLVDEFTYLPLCSARPRSAKEKYGQGWRRSDVIRIIMDYYFLDDFAMRAGVPRDIFRYEPNFEEEDYRKGLETSIKDIMNNIKVAHWEIKRGNGDIIDRIKEYANETFDEDGDFEVFFVAVILMVLWFSADEEIYLCFDEVYPGKTVQIKRAPIICHFYNQLPDTTIEKLKNFIDRSAILDFRFPKIDDEDENRRLVERRFVYTEEYVKIWDSKVRRYIKANANKLLSPHEPRKKHVMRFS
jgi:hypothetical protein